MRSDRELLAAYIQERDDQAFTDLWSRHLPTVTSVIRAVVGNRAEVEDIAQEVFSEFARCAGEIETPGAWLHRVARFRAIDHLRSVVARRGQAAPVREHHDPMRTPAWGVVDQVEEALQSLSATDRTIFVAHVLEGRPQRVVAAEVGLDQAVVSRRIDLARGRMRRRLGELDPASPALAVLGLDFGAKRVPGLAAKTSLCAGTTALVLGGIVVAVVLSRPQPPAVPAAAVPDFPAAQPSVPVMASAAPVTSEPSSWRQHGDGLRSEDLRGLARLADGRWLIGRLGSEPGQGLPVVTADGRPDGFLALPAERVGNHGLSSHAGGLWAVLARRIAGEHPEMRWARELWRLDGTPALQAELDQVTGPIARPAGGIGHIGELTLVVVDDVLVAIAADGERWRRRHPGLCLVAGANALLADGSLRHIDARGELTRLPGTATMIADGGPGVLLTAEPGWLRARDSETGAVLRSAATGETGISGLAVTGTGAWVVAANGTGALASGDGGAALSVSGGPVWRSLGVIDAAASTPDGRWWSNTQVWRDDGSWAGWSIDAGRFPDDPRLHGVGAAPQACQIDGQTLLLLRQDFGNAALLRVGRDGIAVPAAAWMVSADGRRPTGTDWPAAAPATGSWSWSDANGDGAMQADEFTTDPEHGYPGSCWLDSRGGVWRALRQEDGLRYHALSGFSPAQVPRYAPVRVMPVPAPLTAVERLAYDAGHDRLFATGFTAARPAQGDDGRWAGSTLVRVDGWLAGNRRALWQVDIPYEPGSDRNISGLSCADGIVLLGRQRIAEVLILDAATGSTLSALRPPSEFVDDAATGWNPTGLHAASDGAGGYRITAGSATGLIWWSWRAEKR